MPCTDGDLGLVSSERLAKLGIKQVTPGMVAYHENMNYHIYPAIRQGFVPIE